MKKLKFLKKSISVLTMVLILATGLSFSKEEAYAVQPITEITEEEYYGRQQLAKMSNSEKLLGVYDKIADGIENSVEEINVDNPSNPVSVSELDFVFDTYINDYPQHFWRKNGYSYTYYSEERVATMKPTYSMSGTTLTTAKSQYNQAISNIISNINGDMSEFERELILHDTLAEKVSYISSATYAHESYGALVDNKAVCEGYARALQHLLYKAGILSTTVTGKSNGVGHAWNLMRIDGKYYYTDLTWNDQTSTTYHEYFNLTYDRMELDHTLEMDIPMPSATSLDASYHKVIGGWMDSMTVEGIVAEMKDDLVAEVYFDFETSMDELKEWLKVNIYDIAEQCGVTGSYSYSYGHLNREYIIKIITSDPVAKVDVTSVKLDKTEYTLDDVGATFTLNETVYPSNASNTKVAFSSSDTSVAVVDKYTGKVTATGSGTTNIIVTTESGNKTAVCKVTVKGEEELSINSISSSASSIKEGSYVTISATATGGSGDYTYTYIIYNEDTGAWFTLANDISSASYTWRSTSVGSRLFYVEVKDSEGTVVRSDAVSVNVLADSFMAFAYTSSNAINVNDSVTLRANVTTSGTYTYSYIVYNKSTGAWFRLADNIASNTYTWKATSAGDRVFYIDVKSVASGKIVRCNALNISVTDPNLLSVTASVDNSDITIGQKVKFTAVASGGTSPYKYSYIVYNKTNGSWFRLADNISSSTFEWTAGSVGDRIFYIDVKDSTGKIVRATGVNVVTK